MISDDGALVHRCILGDGDALRAFLDRFSDQVFGICLRILRHRQDAEDVTQEVFLRAFRALKSWDRRRPLRPWVMTIAVNRCRTWLKQRARLPESVDYLHETAPSRDRESPDELVSEIHRAVGQLREEYRLVFVLFHEQELPYEEIAQAMEKPVGTVKTWLHRARLEVLQTLRERGMVARNDDDLP